MDITGWHDKSNIQIWCFYLSQWAGEIKVYPLWLKTKLNVAQKPVQCHQPSLKLNWDEQKNIYDIVFKFDIPRYEEAGD